MPAVGRSREQTLTEQLAIAAAKKPVNHVIALRNYYRSLDLLLSQAAAYRAAKNEEQLYVMLMRYASLLIETIPQHKSYASSDRDYGTHKKYLLTSALPELERLKLSLNTKERPAPVARSSSLRRPGDAQQLALSTLPQLDWGTASAPSPDRDAGSMASTSYGGSGSSYQPAYVPSSQQALAKHALLPARPAPGSGRQAGAAPQPPRPRYPAFDSTPTSPIDTLWDGPAGDSGAGGAPSAPGLPELAALSIGAPSAGPSLGPQQVEVITTSASHAPPGATCSAPPPGDPSLALVASEAGGGARPIPKRADLRDVHISVALMEDFLRYAAANTRRGIESCGILAGTLSANDSVFAVTTLIVPKQEGTTDTVAALNEEEIYEVQAGRELYPLGWIHTHPTQTCFLSSVDVHTHCGYQTMLEEAVAIVMAPSDRRKKCGIFRLTTPGGLKLVQNCPLRGFHTHAETATGQDIYELCGHVYLNPRAQHDVVDLR